MCMYQVHTYILIHEHVMNGINKCRHVCTMFRHVCTISPYPSPVQEGKIPDDVTSDD